MGYFGRIDLPAKKRLIIQSKKNGLKLAIKKSKGK